MALCGSDCSSNSLKLLLALLVVQVFDPPFRDELALEFPGRRSVNRVEMLGGIARTWRTSSERRRGNRDGGSEAIA
jgi:hypothetical protein